MVPLPPQAASWLVLVATVLAAVPGAMRPVATVTKLNGPVTLERLSHAIRGATSLNAAPPWFDESPQSGGRPLGLCQPMGLRSTVMGWIYDKSRHVKKMHKTRRRDVWGPKVGPDDVVRRVEIEFRSCWTGPSLQPASCGRQGRCAPIQAACGWPLNASVRWTSPNAGLPIGLPPVMTLPPLSRKSTTLSAGAGSHGPPTFLEFKISFIIYSL